MLEEVENSYNAIPQNNHYIMCFSEQKNLVSQWKKYADNEKGVAIGFNMTAADSLLCICSKRIGIGEGRADTLIYGDHIVLYSKKEIIRLINSQLEECLSLLCTPKDIATMLNELSVIMKRPKFKSEDEVRLIYSPENRRLSPPNEHYDEPIKRFSILKYRSNPSIPYYDFTFDSEFNCVLVPEIILGSKCKCQEEEVRSYLESNGFKGTKVSRHGT